MHELQPKHIKLKTEEVKALLEKFNISLSQLPKINIHDPVIPANCQPGDILKIERKDGDKTYAYFRVVV